MSKLYIGNTAYKVMLGNNTCHFSDLLPYAYQVEYLESTGTQYIDLIVNATTENSFGIQVTFIPKSYNTNCILCESNESNQFIIQSYQYNSENDRIIFSTSIGNNSTSGDISFTPTYKKHTFKLTTAKKVVDDITTNLSRSLTSNFTTLRIFKGLSTDGYSICFYNLKIYIGTNLIYNLIPVVDRQGVGCLYDKISNKLFYNQGSGSFIIGPRKRYQTIENNTFIKRQVGNNELTFNANTGQILTIKGNSIVWNQGIETGIYYNGSTKTSLTTTVINGVTFTTQSDGSILVNGKAEGGPADLTIRYTVPFIANHKIFVRGCPIGGSANTYLLFDNSIGFLTIDTGSGWIYTSRDESYLSIRIQEDYTADNLVFHPQFFDLTVMNYPNIATTTPTVEQVEEWLDKNIGLKDYYPTDLGHILNTKLLGIKTSVLNSWIETKDFDTTRIYGLLNGSDSYVQVFPNGIKNANNIYDLLDLNNNLAQVNIGTQVLTGQETWYYNDHYQIFYTKLSLAKPQGDLISTKYIGICNWTSNQALFTNSDKSIAIGREGFFLKQIIIKDSSYSNISTFKSTTAGIEINYELATPLTYTNLMYDQSQTNDGSDLIPLTSLTYRVDTSGNEEIITPTSINGEPTSTSPIMNIKYSLN